MAPLVNQSRHHKIPNGEGANAVVLYHTQSITRELEQEGGQDSWETEDAALPQIIDEEVLVEGGFTLHAREEDENVIVGAMHETERLMPTWLGEGTVIAGEDGSAWRFI